MANDNAVDEIKLHEQTIANDANSPLHLIREKELEISGRMLSAKRQADELVTEARRKAAEMVAAAEAEGGAGARQSAGSIISQAQDQATQLKAEAQAEAADIGSRVAGHRDAAVDIVIRAVTTV